MRRLERSQFCAGGLRSILGMTVFETFSDILATCTKLAKKFLGIFDHLHKIGYVSITASDPTLLTCSKYAGGTCLASYGAHRIRGVSGGGYVAGIPLAYASSNCDEMAQEPEGERALRAPGGLDKTYRPRGRQLSVANSPSTNDCQMGNQVNGADF